MSILGHLKCSFVAAMMRLCEDNCQMSRDAIV